MAGSGQVRSHQVFSRVERVVRCSVPIAGIHKVFPAKVSQLARARCGCIARAIGHGSARLVAPAIREVNQIAGGACSRPARRPNLTRKPPRQVLDVQFDVVHRSLENQAVAGSARASASASGRRVVAQQGFPRVKKHQRDVISRVRAHRAGAPAAQSVPVSRPVAAQVRGTVVARHIRDALQPEHRIRVRLVAPSPGTRGHLGRRGAYRQWQDYAAGSLRQVPARRAQLEDFHRLVHPCSRATVLVFDLDVRARPWRSGGTVPHTQTGPAVRRIRSRSSGAAFEPVSEVAGPTVNGRRRVVHRTGRRASLRFGPRDGLFCRARPRTQGTPGNFRAGAHGHGRSAGHRRQRRDFGRGIGNQDAQHGVVRAQRLGTVLRKRIGEIPLLVHRAVIRILVRRRKFDQVDAGCAGAHQGKL